MLTRLAALLGADKPAHAPHIETRHVRISASPRQIRQTYGLPYFAVSCSDGTVAILLDAQTNSEFGRLKAGAEMTLTGHWSPTSLVRMHCDRVFHIDAVAD